MARAPRVRLTTGIPSIDAATRGGLPLGKLAIIAGPPGAAKTTLVCQLARGLEAQAAHVVLLAADEEADGMICRWGQAMGLRRDLLDRDPSLAELSELSRRLEAEHPRLHVVDADDLDPAVTIEQASDYLAELSGTAPAVLIVDSIQTASARASRDAEGPRSRVDAVIAALRRAAKRGQLVIATSEVSRGAYRSRNDRIASLASGKESSGIEYGAHLLAMLLASDGPEPGTHIDLHMPKNRLGTKPDGDRPLCRLHLDHETAQLSEVELPAHDHRAAHPVDPRIGAEIVDLVRAEPGLSQRGILDRIAGGRDQIRRALAHLVDAGELAADHGANRSIRYRVCGEPARDGRAMEVSP